MNTLNEIRSKIKEFRPTSHGINLFDPNLNDESHRLLMFNDENNNKFKIWIFSERIKLETSLVTSLLFSINIPDKICLANKQMETISGIGKIFTDNSKDDQIMICINLLMSDLLSLNFDNDEGLTIYGNSLQLTLKNERKIITEIELCNRIKSIIELNFPNKIYKTDYSDLPDSLKQVIVKFDIWSISDDFERNERIDEMTKKEVRELIRIIEPKFNEINSFLDTFGDKPLTDSAIKLQNLAELVCELMIDKST